MHYHVLRTETNLRNVADGAVTEVGIAPSYRAGECVIAADRRNLNRPMVGNRRTGFITSWSRYRCDNQSHE